MKQKILKAIDIVRTYKNWPRLILFRFGVLPGPMEVRLREGSRFAVRARSEQESDIYIINESYLYRIHDGMLPYMAKTKIGIDIGAHIGTFSVFAARKSGAKIYAIEPDPENFAFLERNMRLNGLDGRIVPIPALVSGASGEKELFIFQNKGLNSIHKEHGISYGSPLAATKTVRSISLEDFFSEHKIDFCDFMKVDVEGGEYDIFPSLPKKIFEKIGVIGMEISGDDEEVGRLVKHVESMGFTVTKPRGEYLCGNKRFAGWRK